MGGGCGGEGTSLDAPGLSPADIASQVSPFDCKYCGSRTVGAHCVPPEVGARAPPTV